MNIIKTYLSLFVSTLILALPLCSVYGDANIQGKVTNSATAEPVPGVEVILRSPLPESAGDEVLVTTTTSNGNFVFSNVPSGLPPIKYTVEVVAPTGYVVVSLNPLTTQVASTTVRMNFSIGKPGALEGHVIDAVTQNPIVDAAVDVMRGNNVVVSAVTDNEGYYSISGLAPRPYLVRVRMPYFQTDVRLAVPISDDIVTIDFSLKCPPGRIEGVVIDDVNGDPIGTALVEIIKDGVVLNAVQTNERGEYALTEIAPDRYLVRVTAPRCQTVVQDFSLLTNQTLAADFVLQTHALILGQVVHVFTGLPVKGASVGLWKDNALVDSTQTDENGYYCVSGLNECTIVIQARRFYEAVKTFNIVTKEPVEFNVSLLCMEPPSPRSGSVKTVYSTVAHRVKRSHVIKWKPSPDSSVVTYHIYREEKKIAEVSAKSTLTYSDEWRSGNVKYYRIVAENRFGQKGKPLIIDVED